MKINAFEKITNEIYERLSNFNEITCRNVEDAKERSYIIDNATGYGGYKECRGQRPYHHSSPTL